MRKKIVVVAIFGGIFVAGLTAAGAIFANQNRYGPLTCTSCGLGYPPVDGTTGVFISTYVKKLKKPGLLGPPNFNVFVGGGGGGGGGGTGTVTVGPAQPQKPSRPPSEN